MNDVRLILLIAYFMLASCAGSEKQVADSELHLDKKLIELLTWFPGEYDNGQQVQNEKRVQLTDSLRHRHTHHLFQPVSIDGIPGELLYAQQYQHYDPKDIYRQRIYSFEVDTTEDAIRLTIYTPKEPSRLIDLYLKKELQDSLSEVDFYLKPGCEVYWKKTEGSFKGYLKENACSYYSDRYQKRVYLNETLELRKDALLLDDRAVDKDGNLVFGVDDKGPTINLKVERVEQN